MIRIFFLSIALFSIGAQANATSNTSSPSEQEKLDIAQQKTTTKESSKETATLTPPSKTRRLAAGTIDFIFNSVVFIALSYLIDALQQYFYPDFKPSVDIVDVLKPFVLGKELFPSWYVITKSLLLYFIIIMINTLLGYYRGGYGKRVFGLKIVDREGNPPTFKMLVMRALCRYISIPLIGPSVLFPIPLTWITIPFTSLHLSIPDLIADTRVIYIENNGENIEQKLIKKLYEAIANQNTTIS